MPDFSGSAFSSDFFSSEISSVSDFDFSETSSLSAGASAISFGIFVSEAVVPSSVVSAFSTISSVFTSALVSSALVSSGLRSSFLSSFSSIFSDFSDFSETSAFLFFFPKSFLEGFSSFTSSVFVSSFAVFSSLSALAS